ncbi:hypothetical protein E3N88_14910 [Mikania micrantha]|uniref:Uncharacterized protein n=1 Tax=Mikania micrantha TaxID=192012 RepID=A0A5N6P2S6_9ASTR|nr:hypothetical protein E3N88_14910 [Mikania micrantha]
MLGVAFLNTPDAVAAAESAIASSQLIISLDDNSCIDETDIGTHSLMKSNGQTNKSAKATSEKSQRGKLMGSDGLIVGPRPKPIENYIENLLNPFY